MHEYLTEQEVDSSLRSKIMDELLEKWFVFKQQSTDEEVQVWLEEAMFGILEKVDNGKNRAAKKSILILLARQVWERRRPWQKWLQKPC
ncbi:hypothetical protein RCO48_11275 [Peribacillus frigoritolerans]|nr:hypothetical protein [Peribacillus frigoritolerans]